MRSHESRGEFRGPRDRFRGGDRDRGGFRGGDRDRGGFRGRPQYGSGGSSIDYKGLVEFIAKAVAEKPDEVRVTAFDRGRGAVAIKVKMADSDVGRLIGKSGRNIEALRALVRVASLRERRKVFVDLATPRP
ncbi:MAG TPA: KH domain-containing protein [Candidatus Binatia bacterium]|jgi:predicted RNA-binding protein YlqC (UPF0109 family)|nr:KH domain-containing protein [Candidatus Binatia bacterium]